MEIDTQVRFLRDELHVLARSTKDPACAAALPRITERFANLGKALIDLELRVQALEKAAPQP